MKGNGECILLKAGFKFSKPGISGSGVTFSMDDLPAGPNYLDLATGNYIDAKSKGILNLGFPFSNFGPRAEAYESYYEHLNYKVIFKVSCIENLATQSYPTGLSFT